MLKVVEGKVEKVELDNKGKHDVNMTTAFGDTLQRAVCTSSSVTEPLRFARTFAGGGWHA